MVDYREQAEAIAKRATKNPCANESCCQRTFAVAKEIGHALVAAHAAGLETGAAKDETNAQEIQRMLALRKELDPDAPDMIVG